MKHIDLGHDIFAETIVSICHHYPHLIRNDCKLVNNFEEYFQI